MRKLIASDVFAALRVVAAVEDKTDVKEIVKKIVKEAEAEAEENDDEDAEKKNDEFIKSVGVGAILKLVEMASGKKAEARIYEFLAGPLEMQPEDVKALPIPDFIESVKTIARENDLSSFFDSVLKLKQNM
jgi:fructoselysine-6-P-deglycase FrlB-like protein